jgi:hypothetical protein
MWRVPRSRHGISRRGCAAWPGSIGNTLLETVNGFRGSR